MRYKYHVLILVIAAVMLLAAGCGAAGNGPAGTATAAATATGTPQATGGETTSGGGDLLPDFSVPMVGGGTFKLSEKRGKPVFINLFATWCGPCVEETPEIERLYKDFGDKVEFVVIDIGENEATAKAYADSNAYSVPFAYSLDGQPFPKSQIDFIPQTYVLDANGAIVKYFPGASDYDNFRAAVEKALGQ
jgi:thiol-disulfide isomerase/thioredoxin